MPKPTWSHWLLWNRGKRLHWSNVIAFIAISLQEKFQCQSTQGKAQASSASNLGGRTLSDLQNSYSCTKGMGPLIWDNNKILIVAILAHCIFSIAAVFLMPRPSVTKAMLFNLIAMMNICTSGSAFLKHHAIIILMSSVLYPTTCSYYILCYRSATCAPLFCQPGLSVFSVSLYDCFFYSTCFSLHLQSCQPFSLNLVIQTEAWSSKQSISLTSTGAHWLATPPQFHLHMVLCCKSSSTTSLCPLYWAILNGVQPSWRSHRMLQNDEQRTMLSTRIENQTSYSEKTNAINVTTQAKSAYCHNGELSNSQRKTPHKEKSFWELNKHNFKTEY